RLYRWNGATFVLETTTPLTGTRTLAGLASFDSDGAGPRAREMYYLESDGGAIFRVRNGVRQNVASTVSIALPNLTEYAPADGSGRLLLLVGQGSFSATPNFRGIAGYNGTGWANLGDPLFAFGSNSTAFVTDAAVLDPDGAGPLGQTIVITGAFRVGSQTGPVGLAYLQGDQWVALGSALGGVPVFSGSFRLVPLPANESSTTLPRAVLLGSFTSVNGVPARGAAQLVGLNWQESPLASTALSPSALSVAFDADGAGGPLPVEVSLERFPTVTTLSEHRDIVLASDGVTRRVLPATLIGSAGVVRELRELPDDGGTTRLHAAGSFAYAGSRLVGSAVKLVDGSWQPLSSPIGGTTTSITRHDFDGAGPLPAQYVRLSREGPPTTNPFSFSDVSVLAGQAWTKLQTSAATGAPATFLRLDSWDPDGDGPGAPALLGSTPNVSQPSPRPGVLVNDVWRVLGVFPVEFPNPFGYSELLTWDSDGAGPLPARLYINFNGLFRFEGIGTDPAQWGSSPWTRLSTASGPGAGLTIDRAIGNAALLFNGTDTQSFQIASIVRRFAMNEVAEVSLAVVEPSGGSSAESRLSTWDYDAGGPMSPTPVISPVRTVNADQFSLGTSPWNYRASVLRDGRWYG
ncbi:MAG: hypothetical protein K2X32_07745, partial [Phycisphaerales bacterium]|nr:hypothetical protein [Phycisphaerales bacterium]